MTKHVKLPDRPANPRPVTPILAHPDTGAPLGKQLKMDL